MHKIFFTFQFQISDAIFLKKIDKRKMLPVRARHTNAEGRVYIDEKTEMLKIKL